MPTFEFSTPGGVSSSQKEDLFQNLGAKIKVFRNDKIIIPNSQTIFNENDDVVFFAESNCIKKLEQILSIDKTYA